MDKKPNRRVIRRWVNALRSGKYKQGVGHLNTDDGFCCLGVLCDLYVRSKAGREAGAKWVSNESLSCNSLSGAGASGNHLDVVESYSLPPKVMKWAGLEDDDPTLRGAKRASELNDYLGLSFRQIATLIEKKYLS